MGVSEPLSRMFLGVLYKLYEDFRGEKLLYEVPEALTRTFPGLHSNSLNLGWFPLALLL